MKGDPAVITPDSFQTLGALLRYLRERAHLSQRELASMVDYHYSYIGRIEKNTHAPDTTMLTARFVPALGLEHEPEWVARLVELASGERRRTSDSVRAPTIAHDSASGQLPVSFTPLLGREHEADALWGMLRRADIRLVTLVGPPGVGKTRLAIHAADQVASWFPDGVLFVDLTPITEANQVVSAIASALGIPEASDPSPLASLQSRLRNQRTLIVLDNFEQVIAAAPQIARLLASSPEVKILATSREALRLSAEHIFPIQPLPLPESTSGADLQALTTTPVIRLFVDRARTVRPDFALTEENASYVVEICARLDGLPLAIELAAARVNLLSPRDMLDQLDHRFQWLTNGARDSHTWRQTMRGALDWSYNLLNEAERTFLQRLSVFAGGWTLPAAEAVCAADALPLLLQLVNKSLVVAEPEQGRYHLFETMREFAEEKLTQAGELQATRARHLTFFAGWAERLEADLDSMSLQDSGLMLESERNNLHVALSWALEETSSRAEGLRLVTAASRIWFEHSHFSEGWEWAEKFLPHSTDSKFPSLRARLLYRAAALAEFAYWRGKHEPVKALFQESESLARRLKDQKILAHALYYHTEVYMDDRDWEGACRALEESIALSRELSDQRLLCLALSDFGVALHTMGKKEETRRALDEALEIATRQNDLRGQGYALRKLVHTLRADSDFAAALAANQRALEITRASGDRINTGQALVNMAVLANALDDFPTSGRYAKDAYATFQSIGSEYQQPFPERLIGYAMLHAGDLVRARELAIDSGKRNIVLGEGHVAGVYGGLILLAEIELAEKNFPQAARLFGFVAAKDESEPLPFQEPDRRAFERVQRAIQKKKTLRSSQESASHMTLEEVLQEVGLNNSAG